MCARPTRRRPSGAFDRARDLLHGDAGRKCVGRHVGGNMGRVPLAVRSLRLPQLGDPEAAGNRARDVAMNPGVAASFGPSAPALASLPSVVTPGMSLVIKIVIGISSLSGRAARQAGRCHPGHRTIHPDPAQSIIADASHRSDRWVSAAFVSSTSVDLRQFDLNLLVAFDALMTDGSVTRAAQRLHIGQSAMSATLARLRRHLDDPLFVRDGRYLTPTPVASRSNNRYERCSATWPPCSTSAAASIPPLRNAASPSWRTTTSPWCSSRLCCSA